MVDIMDRRVTRSLSNELARQAAQQAASHSYVVPSSYHVHNFQPHPHAQQQQQNQEPSSSGMNHYQQQQSLVGMNGGGMGSSSMGGVLAYPRTTSDEMFLNTLMNTPLSPGTPTMEAASLGFFDSLQPQPAMPQTMRGNSEELFNSWLTTTSENSNQYQNNVYSGPSSNGNRPRQNSRRMSSELQAIIAQQNGTPWAPRADNVEQAYMQTNPYLSDDVMSNVNSDQKQYRPNASEDKSGLADYSNAGSLKNMWFNAASPMTRSRSSELRRRYAQMEGLPAPPPVDVFQKLATQGTLEGLVTPAMISMGTFTRGVGPIGNNGRHPNNPEPKQMGTETPLVPTMSSSPAPVNHKQQMQQQQLQQQQIQQQPAAATNALTDVVGLLKGSLERKKLQTKQQQMPSRQQQMSQQRQMPPQQQEPQQGMKGRPTQEPQQGVRGRSTPMSSPQVSTGVSARQDEALHRSQDHRKHMHGDSGIAYSGQVQQNSGMGRVHSPDESSCGAPAPSYSAGIATSDGPSNSAMSVHRQALKRGSGTGAVDQPSPKRQQAFSGIDSGLSNGDNLENGATKSDVLKKPDQLARAGSITSSVRNGFQLNELDGATRKRRVERQRKMAEMKGRGNAPPMPADMQAAVKRCEALEKEVRSLKLNLSFMNRKDSEQTKKIEELEQQNDELKEERDRLLEELSAIHDPQ